MTIDLNCDLGEGYPNDAALMPLISSANIACGRHAGDAETMRITVSLALEHGVAVGAHPGFDDRANFGRLPVQLTARGYRELVWTQLEGLDRIVRAAGGALRHIKPHGALYNMSAKDPELAAIIARAVYEFDPGLILYGLSGSVSIAAAHALGLRTASEVFADRSYQPDGSLTPRSAPNALIRDEEKCLVQVLEMVQHHSVTAVDGTRVPIQAETICLHGDGAHAVAFASALRGFLAGKGIAVSAP